MEFGRSTSKELKLAYSLPSPIYFSSLSGGVRPCVRVGLPILGHAGYVGRIYPNASVPKMEWYSKSFLSIEYNGSFYKIPSAQEVDRWKHSCERPFELVSKIPKAISHDNLRDSDQLKWFLSYLDDLGELAGPSFLQLPPHFQELAELERFIVSWPRERKLGVELRHSSFFQNPLRTREACEMLSKYHVSFVTDDTTGLRGLTHQCVTADFMIVRFLGNLLHSSDFQRLDLWTSQFSKLKGIDKVYFFIHQPDESKGIDLALHIQQEWMQRPIGRNIQKQTNLLDTLI